MNAKALAAVLVVLAVPAVAQTRLELEVGAGAHGKTDAAPTLTARVGLDVLGWLTPSVRFVTLAPLNTRQAFAVLGELRAHTDGEWQLDGGLGVGLGTASVMAGFGGVTADVERVAPYLLMDVGARYVSGHFFAGVNVGGAPFAQQWLITLSIGVAAFG